MSQRYGASILDGVSTDKLEAELARRKQQASDEYEAKKKEERAHVAEWAAYRPEWLKVPTRKTAKQRVEKKDAADPASPIDELMASVPEGTFVPGRQAGSALQAAFDYVACRASEAATELYRRSLAPITKPTTYWPEGLFDELRAKGLVDPAMDAEVADEDPSPKSDLAYALAVISKANERLDSPEGRTTERRAEVQRLLQGCLRRFKTLCVGESLFAHRIIYLFAKGHRLHPVASRADFDKQLASQAFLVFDTLGSEFLIDRYNIADHNPFDEMEEEIRNLERAQILTSEQADRAIHSLKAQRNEGEGDE